jgi:hypothetical protein
MVHQIDKIKRLENMYTSVRIRLFGICNGILLLAILSISEYDFDASSSLAKDMVNS